MRKHWKVKESSLLLLCFLNIKTVFGGSEPKQLNVVPPREIPGIEESRLNSIMKTFQSCFSRVRIKLPMLSSHQQSSLNFFVRLMQGQKSSGKVNESSFIKLRVLLMNYYNCVDLDGNSPKKQCQSMSTAKLCSVHPPASLLPPFSSLFLLIYLCTKLLWPSSASSSAARRRFRIFPRDQINKVLIH